MKVGSDPNYTVGVRERCWEEPPEQADLYGGMYTFDVNQVFEKRILDSPWFDPRDAASVGRGV